MTDAQKIIPSVEDDKKRLARLAAAADALKDDEWRMDCQGTQTRVSVKRRNGAEAVILQFSPDALSDEIELASSALEILLLLFRTRSRAAEQFRKLQDQKCEKPALRSGDFTTEAAMKLQEAPFRRFLEEIAGKGPVRDAAAADRVLKLLLGIESKKQLNEDMVAQQAWFDLRARYDAWNRGDP